MNMTKDQKEEMASRVARAVTDAYNRTNEMPTEEELKAAILYVLDTTTST